jgi:carbonic anhydrase/acetyltransferase-like protein (isoleucine patch superfamily)
MLVDRHGVSPQVAEDAWVASTAQLVGDVTVGAGCTIDHGALIVSGGPPIRLGTGVAVMPGAVIRSTGGQGRPSFPVDIGDDCLIGPQAALAGCTLGEAVYVATQVMVFHGATVGDGCRLGAGCIVHTKADLPARSRVGMRQFAIAQPNQAALVTGDLDTARTALARADFFSAVFDIDPGDRQDLVELHRRTTRALTSELRALARPRDTQAPERDDADRAAERS